MEKDDSKNINNYSLDNWSKVEQIEELSIKQGDNNKDIIDTTNNVNNTSELTYGISKDDYKREKSKKGLYILAFIGVIAVGIIAVIIGKMSNNNKVQEQPVSIPVATPTDFVLIPTPVLTDKPTGISTDRTEQLLSDLSKDIYNPIMGSEIYEIKDYIIDIKISPNKEHSVLLSDGGDLLYYCTEKKAPVEISSTCSDIIMISDNGFFYCDLDGNVHRYMFYKETDNILGAYKNCCFSSENLNVSYVKDNVIYLLAQSFDEIKEIGKTDHYDCKVTYVSKDGSLVYWSEYYFSTKKEFIYEYRDGVTSKKLEIVNSKDKDIISVHSIIKTDKYTHLTTIYSPVAYEIYVLTYKNDILQYELDHSITSEFYSKNGVLWDDDAKYEGFFVSTSYYENSWSLLPGSTIETSQTLWFFNQYGMKYEIKQHIKDFIINNGYIYYTDYLYNLYRAKLQGYKSLSNEDAELIDINVIEILNEMCTEDTIYYLKKPNNKDDKSIVSNSVTWGTSLSSFLYGDIWMYKSISGKRIFSDNGFVPGKIKSSDLENIPSDIRNKIYFKDVEYSLSIGEYIGDLFIISDVNEQNEIASKVIVSSIHGSHNSIDCSDIYISYNRYSEYDSIGTKSEWYYYSKDGQQLMIRNTIK